MWVVGAPFLTLLSFFPVLTPGGWHSVPLAHNTAHGYRGVGHAQALLPAPRGNHPRLAAPLSVGGVPQGTGRVLPNEQVFAQLRPPNWSFV